MSLAELRLEDLRCLPRVQLTLHPRLNLITGDNGSGKTTILEAIYLLGRGRSFRTRHTEQLIAHAATELRVFGRIEARDHISHSIGLGYSRIAGLTARIDGQDVRSLAALSERFPVQVIDPGIHRLVEEGPVQRRRWLDWAVFHVEPDFVRHWQAYNRSLRQRNAALKSGTEATLWDWELVRLGQLLNDARRRLVDALQPYWAAALRDLDAAPVSLTYFQGWGRDQELGAALTMHMTRDKEQGSTSYGPHRFDVLLRLEGHPARDLVSRGQQKVIGSAMALTMTRYVAEVAGRAPTLLLDDPAAELDRAHTQALLTAVSAIGGQLVVTALRPEDTPLGSPDQVFHVEHKEVKTAIMGG